MVNLLNIQKERAKLAECHPEMYYINEKISVAIF